MSDLKFRVVCNDVADRRSHEWKGFDGELRSAPRWWRGYLETEPSMHEWEIGDDGMAPLEPGKTYEVTFRELPAEQPREEAEGGDPE